MADEAASRVRARQRVASTAELFRNAYNRLMLARALIEMPVPPPTEIAEQGPLAWFARYRLKHVLALEKLTEATLDLSFAVAFMEAAEILALDHPSLPLKSIDDLGPLEAPLKATLGWLQVSRVITEGARKFAERCRGHLSTQINLIGSVHSFPGATQIARINAEQTSAYHALAYAIQWTWDARGLVVIAHEFL